MTVNTSASTISRKFPGRKRPLIYVDGFVTIRGVKYYAQGHVMKILDISRPTYYKWVAEKKIRRMEITDPVIGGEKRFVVSENELERLKSIIKEGWVRGKAKLPKGKSKLPKKERK